MITATPFRPAQLDQLQRDGFCISDPLFPAADLAAVEAVFRDLSNREPDRVGGNFASSLHLHHPVLAAFCLHPVFADCLRQLFGPDASVWQTWNQMIVKRPHQAGRFGWHQDAYYGTYSPNGSIGPEHPDDDFVTGTITFWVAITPTTIANGCLWALPGRHHRGLLPHTWDPVAKEWQGQYPTDDAVPAELRPGQMLVFTRLTPHASGANTTDTHRMGYQIGYSTNRGIRDQIPFLLDGAIVPSARAAYTPLAG